MQLQCRTYTSNITGEKVADINAVSENKSSALEAATVKGCAECVRFLLDEVADVNLKGKFYGFPRHAVANFGSRSVIRLLLETRADVRGRRWLKCTRPAVCYKNW